MTPELAVLANLASQHAPTALQLAGIAGWLPHPPGFYIGFEDLNSVAYSLGQALYPPSHLHSP